MISDLGPVEYAWICDKPLVIFESDTLPGKFGIVIVDWCCHLSFWIGQCRRIIAETPGLASRIRQRLEVERHEPMPLIAVMEVHHAA
jgi:hypothetical protein